MYPRANTLGIIVKGNYLLLEEQKGKHSKGVGFYYRPIGGTIELGERSNQTLVREFSEELGVEIIVRRYISCIENIFKIDKSVGHEITQIYFVDFKDRKLYQKEHFTVTEGNKITRAKWVSKEEIFSGEKLLYPQELIELLKQQI
ncbi:NUDIX domain-containing protein [Rossellomorea sp. SC111]|uniref:NUDIX hydrolase n=1 Tax=Rossellomorea sp. SC111 TaxID=2968985 RepID=UPI00215B0EA1|nr:NUDIX domain-containing protein [Rossellomorea sp. SC111]MCR8848329.1 NUDIX domain-containing protein [Rossellomorea sp. SC111]